MKSTRYIRTVLRSERARLLGMGTVTTRPARRTAAFAIGR